MSLYGNALNISVGFLTAVFLLINCGKEYTKPANKPPDLYLDFERSVEPFQIIPSRSVDSDANNNGCLPTVAWNQFYNFNVCIASTCELTDFAIERTDLFARSGNSSIRFYLKPTPLDKWPLGEATHRAELGPGFNAPFNRFPKVGEERWYGLSIFFPASFRFAPGHLESDLRFSLAQWQHGSEGPPTFALEVYGSRLAVARSTGISTAAQWIEPEFLGEIKRGEWMDLVIQIKWEKQDGAIKVWVNSKEKYSKSAVQTVYDNLEVGGGFKIGLYYWRWQYQESVRNSLNAGIIDREIFIDEVREYLGQDGASAVTPGNTF